MKITRLHISFFVALSAILWIGLLRLNGDSFALSYLQPYGAVVGIMTASILFVEHFLWKCPILHGWFIEKPNIEGTWRVNLYSDLNGQDSAPIECYMGIKQTLSKLQMHLMTQESESWLIANEIRKSPSAYGYQIVGVYTNMPGINLRHDKSNIHLGALVLNTHGQRESKPESMTGEYWTDRKSTGRLIFDSRVPKLYTRFTDARMAISSEK